MWQVELDDVVVALKREGCICLRCYLRETGDTRRMPKDVVREVEEALQACA
jgi:hypothetical protein